MVDASFEDGAEKPVNLGAESAEDLSVISALCQDAVTQPREMSWQPAKRRFALLLNRFRWEDKPRAEKQNRPYERVQATLVFEDVHAVKATGVSPSDKDAALDLLAIRFDGTEGDTTGTITLQFADGAEMALSVECLSAHLRDASRPYIARASRAPDHGE